MWKGRRVNVGHEEGFELVEMFAWWNFRPQKSPCKLFVTLQENPIFFSHKIILIYSNVTLVKTRPEKMALGQINICLR